MALGDLGERDSLHRAMAGVSGVVHTACTFSHSRLDAAAHGIVNIPPDPGPGVEPGEAVLDRYRTDRL